MVYEYRERADSPLPNSKTVIPVLFVTYVVGSIAVGISAVSRTAPNYYVLPLARPDLGFIPFSERHNR